MDRLSAEDIEELKKAVRDVELKSSGEIVPVIVEMSDNYSEANHKIALFTTFLAMIIYWSVEGLLGRWGAPVYAPLAAGLIGATVGGLASALFPGIRRKFLDREWIDEKVLSRARAEFLEHEVFRTVDRTGVLIFLSLYEHEAVILSDSGIHQRVGSDGWKLVVDSMILHLKKNDIKGAMLEGIRQSGDLLLRHGFYRKAADVNEIGNQIRIEKDPQ